MLMIFTLNKFYNSLTCAIIICEYFLPMEYYMNSSFFVDHSQQHKIFFFWAKKAVDLIRIGLNYTDNSSINGGRASAKIFY